MYADCSANCADMSRGAGSAMRVLFFGTSEFAVPSLAALCEDPAFQIVAVVTQPDRPSGRGRHLARPPVKEAAEERGLHVVQPERVRRPEFVEWVRSLAPDAIALASFGQIIPVSLLQVPPLGPINVHASLLPKYRGAAPIQRAIMNGETVTGVCTMWMEPTLDTGDVLLREEVPILPDETGGELTERLAAVGARLLVETLKRLAQGDCPRQPQNHSEATYAPAITPEDARIDWNEPAERTVCRVRAMAPRPGAVAELAGRRIKVWRAELAEGSGSPGEVTAVGPKGVCVAAGDAAVCLLEVQPENGRRMSALDWARGLRLAPGRG